MKLISFVLLVAFPVRDCKDPSHPGFRDGRFIWFKAHQCEHKSGSDDGKWGNTSDLKDFSGSAEECKANCLELGPVCGGFVRLENSTCKFHEYPIDDISPQDKDGDSMDCYVMGPGSHGMAVLDEIASVFDERGKVVEGIHTTLHGAFEGERFKKGARKERIDILISDLTSVIKKDTAEMTALSMEKTKMEDELSEIEQSLESASTRLTKLDAEYMKTDAGLTAALNAMEAALASLVKAAPPQEVVDGGYSANKDFDAAVLLSARVDSTAGDLGRSKGNLDVIIGTFKGIQEKLEKDKKEGAEKYSKTRNETTVLIDTLSKSSEDQAHRLGVCKAKLAEVTSRKEISEEEREQLNTKMKGNELVLEEYLETCDELKKIGWRHNKRMGQASQVAGFTKAAVQAAREPSLLSQKYGRQSLPGSRRLEPHLHTFLPRDAPPEPLSTGRSVTHIGGENLHTLAAPAHPPASLALYLRSTSQKNASRLKASLNSLHSSEAIVGVDPSAITKRQHQLTNSGHHHPPLAALESWNPHGHCKESLRDPATPAALAASWALKDSATKLHSSALKRVACEVQQREPASARQMLAALSHSLQKRISGVASPKKEDADKKSECQMKKVAFTAELRTAQIAAGDASAETKAANMTLLGLQNQLRHLSPYLPKLKNDQAGVGAGVAFFEMLKKQDTELAEGVEKMLDDLKEDFEENEFASPERAMTRLFDLVNDLPAKAEADLREANNGIMEISEKLAIRVSLVSSEMKSLEKRIKETEEKLEEREKTQKEADKALEEVLEKKSKVTCPKDEPEEDASLLLLSQHRRSKMWIMQVELAAVKLATGLLG